MDWLNYISVFGNDGEEELQMAAANDNPVRLTSNNLVQYEAELDNNVDYDDYNWDKIFAQYGSSF